MHFHAGVSLGSSVVKRVRVAVVHRRHVGTFEHRKQQAQVRRFEDEVARRVRREAVHARRGALQVRSEGCSLAREHVTPAPPESCARSSSER